HARSIRPIGRRENRVGSMAVSRPPVRQSEQLRNLRCWLSAAARPPPGIQWALKPMPTPDFCSVRLLRGGTEIQEIKHMTMLEYLVRQFRAVAAARARKLIEVQLLFGSKQDAEQLLVGWTSGRIVVHPKLHDRLSRLAREVDRLNRMLERIYADVTGERR